MSKLQDAKALRLSSRQPLARGSHLGTSTFLGGAGSGLSVATREPPKNGIRLLLAIEQSLVE
jgi:hypothetical protein